MKYQERLTTVLASLSITIATQVELLLHLRAGLPRVRGDWLLFDRRILPGL